MASAGLSLRRILDIYPIGGLITSVPAKKLPLDASPDMSNMQVVLGRLRKRPGYTSLGSSSALTASIVGIASVQDEENATHLFAITEDDLWKYDGSSSWSQMTGPTLTGSSAQLFSHEVSQNSLVFSQGVDQVMRMPFTGSTYAVLNANCPPARYMTRAASRLLLAHTVESAVSKPFRVRRPVAGDHTDWTGVGSGFTDLDEYPYHLQGIKKIGARVAVYAEKAIHLGTRTGDASAPLLFEPVIPGTGLLAPFTLKERKGLHMFLGNDSVYEFNGSQVTDIGFSIRDEIFNTLNASALARMFAEVLNETQEYLLFVSTGSSGSPNKVWVHNWGRRIWYPWTVSGPQCATLHRLDGSTTWDSLAGTWDSYALEWDSYALQQAYPALVTGHDDSKVYIWSPLEFGDNGAAIRAYWTSKDLCSEDVHPELLGKKITLRDIGIWFRDPGSDFTFNVYYSTDAGDSWDGPYAHTVSTEGTGDLFYRVDKQVSGSTVRFRIEQESASQTLMINSIHPDVEVRDTPI